MTTGLICLLVGLAVVVWPSRPSGPPTAAPSSPTPWPVLKPILAVIGRRRARGRDPAGTEEVADALVLISLALRAGLPLPEALHHVHAEATGRVRADLAAVTAALRWGRPAQDAWSFAGPGWRAAVVATHMSEHTGAGPAGLIDQAAGRLREERERERERAAARAGVLLVLPLGLGFLPAFVCTAVVPVVLNLASGVLSAGS